ncbi:cytochrome b5 reductase family protein, partial [Aspergillus glaucus CBS 516.65]
LTFTKYTLIAKEPVSSTGSIFTLKPPKPDLNSTVYEAAWQNGVWSVMFKQPQLQIGRDYTPLPVTSTTDNEDEDVLRFFIRKDAFGEMSRYLHGLGIGSLVEMRGPKIEYKIPRQTQEILFIAGGTGIAPALQAGYTLLHRTDETRKPRIHILWANRRREDCAGGANDTCAKPQGARRFWFFGPRTSPESPAPVTGDADRDATAQSLVVRELEALKSQYPGQVTVDYFVDEETTFIKKQDILDFTNSARSSGSRFPKNKMILVSGPEGFINYMAGPKLWAQGTEVQGPLRGIISELDLKGWATWKL